MVSWLKMGGDGDRYGVRYGKAKKRSMRIIRFEGSRHQISQAFAVILQVPKKLRMGNLPEVHNDCKGDLIHASYTSESSRFSTEGQTFEYTAFICDDGFDNLRFVAPDDRSDFSLPQAASLKFSGERILAFSRRYQSLSARILFTNISFSCSIPRLSLTAFGSRVSRTPSGLLFALASASESGLSTTPVSLILSISDQ